jgi:protein-glutamine gamma-glutamyltransferase
VKAVRGLVDFQGHVRMRFALSANTNLDPKYFRRDSRSFVLQRGVRASQALDALYKDLENYGFECATAISIVHYAAIRDVLRQLTGSDAEFDRRFKDLRIGQLTMGTENDVREARSYVRGQIQVGDHGYFSTPDVDPTARLNGWNGENVIYLGDGRYFGHPFGISDAKTIISHLNRQRRQGLRNPRPATLQSGQWRLEASDLFVR